MQKVIANMNTPPATDTPIRTQMQQIVERWGTIMQPTRSEKKRGRDNEENEHISSKIKTQDVSQSPAKSRWNQHGTPGEYEPYALSFS